MTTCRRRAPGDVATAPSLLRTRFPRPNLPALPRPRPPRLNHSLLMPFQSCVPNSPSSSNASTPNWTWTSLSCRSSTNSTVDEPQSNRSTPMLWPNSSIPSSTNTPLRLESESLTPFSFYFLSIDRLELNSLCGASACCLYNDRSQ